MLPIAAAPTTAKRGQLSHCLDKELFDVIVSQEISGHEINDLLTRLTKHGAPIPWAEI